MGRYRATSGSSSTCKSLYRVDSFPAGVKKSHIIYHNLFDDFFVCNNGVEEGADTTLKGNWVRGGKIEIDHLLSPGQPEGKLIRTDGLDGFVYTDCDGGVI